MKLLTSVLFSIGLLQIRLVDSAQLSEFKLIENPDPKSWKPLAGPTKVERFSKNIPNLSQASKLVSDGKVTHYYMDGPWAIFLDPDYERLSEQATQVEFSDGLRYKPTKGTQWGPTAASVSRHINGTQVTTVFPRVPLSIRHIGNIEQNSVGLSFYTKAHYGGEELYFNGARLILPYPINFDSYGYSLSETGKRYQILFDFATDPKCFGFDDSTTKYKLEEEKQILVRIISQEFCKLDSLDSTEDSGNVTQSNIIDTILENVRKSVPEVEQPGIALYTVENRMLYFEGSELSLPFRHDAAIIRILGNRNFTVYSGSNMDGDSKCLIHTDYNDSILNYMYGGLQPKTTLTVRSIKRGCSSDPKPACGLEGYEYEILGYNWKNPRPVFGDNANPILNCL